MKQLTLSLLLSLPLFFNTAQAKHLNLGEHNKNIEKTIEFLDGHFGRIDGATIGILVHVAQKIKNLHHGAQNGKGVRIGSLEFEGKLYSVAELAELESKYPNNPVLKELLIHAKKAFENLVNESMAHARGVKNSIIPLIRESCSRRNHKDSLLLTWADVPEGNETIIFHTEIQTFKALNDFCQHLTDFLGDLTESCPKAKEQFLREMQQAKANR